MVISVRIVWCWYITSLTAAIMPAAARLAPIPGVGSTTVTLCPALCRFQAAVSPATPAPTTMVSGVCVFMRSFPPAA